MSAVLPRNKKKSNAPRLSRSSDASKKMKKSFQGVNQNFVASESNGAEIVPHHLSLVLQPWAQALNGLLRPLPPDWQYNVQRAVSTFAEAIGRLFPSESETKSRIGRRGF